MHITIGSRGSDLALWQAHFVKGQLEDLGAEVTIKIIKTQGDQIQHLSFDKMEGKGFFTKEIEAELLANTIDLAVHSHKDLETNQPEGLTVACVSYRANPSDVLLIRKSSSDTTRKWSLKENACIGTSSARRKSLLLAHLDGCVIKDLRGNVPTRIDKLRSGDYDAILLAKAGLDRLELNISDLVVVELDPKEFVPAPAQGVLGLQIRESDTALKELLSKMNHADVQQRIYWERLLLNRLEGGCQLPLGAYVDESGVFHVAFARSMSEPTEKYTIDDELTEELIARLVTSLKS